MIGCHDFTFESPQTHTSPNPPATQRTSSQTRTKADFVVDIDTFLNQQGRAFRPVRTRHVAQSTRIFAALAIRNRTEFLPPACLTQQSLRQDCRL